MSDAEKILTYFKDHQKELLGLLKEFVELESPTYESKEASDKCGLFLQRIFKDLGFRIQVIPQTKCGDHIIAEYGSGEKGVLFVGHYDTVFPLGTLKTMPFRIDEDKAYGPGVLDMKGGILLGYYAVKALKELELLPNKKITFFFNSDEEPGSFTSSGLIVAEAKKNKHALILEPGNFPVLENELGRIKTARYGRGTYRIAVQGKSAHSGGNPEEAISAMTELAHQILKIQSMNDYEKGFTLAPTCMSSGIEGTCMVPGEGWLSMDVRFLNKEIAEEKNRQILNLKPILPGATIEVTGGIDKPPLVADPALIKRAEEIGRELGMNIEGVVGRGGTDGNFTSGAGVSTLCGLGLTGRYIHNAKEFIYTGHIPQRGALVARLLQTL